MKLYQLITITLLTSCDAVQEKSGIILNAKSRQPLEGVAISKYEEEDTTNNFTRRVYSNKNGQFEFNSTGMTNSFELFIMKEGFKTKKITNKSTDTVLLEPIN